MAAADLPPPSPPRLVGNADADLGIIYQWVQDFYDSVVRGQKLVDSAGQGDDSMWSPDPLPSPAASSIALAQRTGNEAFANAATAQTTADGAQTAASAAQTTANGAASAAATAQLTANAAAADALSALSRAPVFYGTLTIADLAVSGVVTFTAPLPDTSYVLIAQAVSSVGAAAAGAFTVTGITKTTADATIAVQAAPGAATSVTFDIIVFRII